MRFLGKLDTDTIYNSAFPNMLYCSISTCLNPFNPDGHKFCQSCGAQTLASLFRNRYRVIRLLGEGGFGRTYEARDADRMDDPCVIKQFFPQVQGTAALEKATALFKQEAQRLYELGEHSQIPRLIAYFEQDKRLYLVQELIEGQNLLEELQQQGAFSEGKIRQLLMELLPVLKFVHEHGVIHRDIKPENIMRRRQDGMLILIDFGVSKQATGTVAQVGTTVGTPGYAPMEQMRGQVLPASDLYSLGVTCIRLLTLCLPNEDGSDNLYDASEGHWMWRDRLPFGTTVSPQLGQVLDKLTQDYVKVRYQSAEQVLQALNPITSRFIGPLTDNLSSARRIDYKKLRDLLAAGKWQEADKETRAIMLKVCNRENKLLLTQTQIEEFPCEDLHTIDQIWVKYSNGHFGFSVQKLIWQMIGGCRQANYQTECDFGDWVGWRVQGDWLSWNNFNFTMSSPVGHLPGALRFASLSSSNVRIGVGFLVSSLTLRLEKCNIQ